MGGTEGLETGEPTTLEVLELVDEDDVVGLVGRGAPVLVGGAVGIGGSLNEGRVVENKGGPVLVGLGIEGLGIEGLGTDGVAPRVGEVLPASGEGMFGENFGGLPDGRGGLEIRGGPAHCGEDGIAVTVVVTVTVRVTVACWRFSSPPWGRAKAPAARADVRRMEERIVDVFQNLGSDVCADAPI